MTSKTTYTLSRREWLTLTACASITRVHAQGSSAEWSAIETAARGQKVYFNAWGGSERTNAYLQWVAAEVEKRFGVKMEHVKLTDTVEAVKRVRNEKAAGKLSDGNIDLMWINGENFLSMKREGLLFGPFAEKLPSYAFVDVVGKPTTRIDFSEPVDGMEAPWGMAQLTFYADRKRVPNPPRSVAAWLDFAKANPGRVTYPRPPNFHGTTFVKQALIELSADRSLLYKPYTVENLAKLTPPLWAWLDALHPSLWRSGRQFPQNAAAVRQMMVDGELMAGLTFNPNEAANEIAAKRMPDTVYSWQNSGGSIGNTHFLAVPFNAKAKEGAQVAVNFMLSAEAQARKADITVWGDSTVLDVGKLPAAERERFGNKPFPGQLETVAPTLAEPHGSWVDPLEREWLRRYGQ